MTDVYFLEADDQTAPAVSCEGKNTILVALVMLKIKCFCCNLGREEKEDVGYFSFVDMDYYYFKAYLYTVFTLYMLL